MGMSLASELASQPEVVRNAILDEMTDEELAQLEYDWEFWARPEQLPPPGDWATWTAIAGRGFGKTEAGAQWVKSREQNGARQIALIAETQKDLEEVMVARLLAIYPEHERPTVRYKPVRVLWPSGALARGYNGTEPDQLRGPEFDTAWVDELAKYRYAQGTWDMLQFTMRVGEDPRVLVTTTPRPIPVLKDILKDPSTAITRGSTFDNADNLPPQFLRRLRKRYLGTRLGRQELNAELLEDVPGALWTANMFLPIHDPKGFSRVVVAIDPSGASGEDTDQRKPNSIGIIVAAKYSNADRYVILEDGTCDLGPAGWAKRAIDLYERYSADRIVAEANFGGAMVKSNILSVNRNVPVRMVTASRGKVVRAEPVSALYEQKRVDHAVWPARPREDPGLGLLEAQMMQMTGSGYVGEGSPDRVDAAVWAISDLLSKEAAKTTTTRVKGLI